MFIQTGLDIQLTTLKYFALADLDVEKSQPLMYIYFFWKYFSSVNII